MIIFIVAGLSSLKMFILFFMSLRIIIALFISFFILTVRVCLSLAVGKRVGDHDCEGICEKA